MLVSAFSQPLRRPSVSTSFGQAAVEHDPLVLGTGEGAALHPVPGPASSACRSPSGPEVLVQTQAAWLAAAGPPSMTWRRGGSRSR